MNQSNTEKNRQFSGEDEMFIDLGEVFLRLLEKLPVIILCAVIGGLLMLLYTMFLYKPRYETIAKIYLVDTEKKEVVNNTDLQLGNSLAQDYLQIFEMDPLKNLAKAQLGEENEDALLTTKVTPSNPTGTHMIYVKVASVDPEDARIVANAYAVAACDFMESRMSVPRPTILEEAPLSEKPASLSNGMLILIGAVVGAFLTALVITILFVFDDRFKREEDFSKYFNLPCLGVVTNHNSKHKGTQKSTEKHK